MTIEEIKERIRENLKKAKYSSSLPENTGLATNESFKTKVIEFVIYQGLKYKGIFSKIPIMGTLSKKLYYKLRRIHFQDFAEWQSEGEQNWVSKAELASLKHLDGEAFIKEAYRIILAREPDSTEYDIYMRILQTRGKRAKTIVIRNLALSSEAIERGIKVDPSFWDRWIISFKKFLKLIPFSRIILRKPKGY